MNGIDSGAAAPAPATVNDPPAPPRPQPGAVAFLTAVAACTTSAVSGENVVGSRFTRPSTPALRTRLVTHRLKYSVSDGTRRVLEIELLLGLSIIITDYVGDLFLTQLRGTITDCSSHKVLINNKTFKTTFLTEIKLYFALDKLQAATNCYYVLHIRDEIYPSFPIDTPYIYIVTFKI